MKLKMILILIITVISVTTFAGEMSQIDAVVRDTVTSTYLERSNSDNYHMNYEDIWGLNIEATQEGCFIVVSGFAKVQLDAIYVNNKFWVCINRAGFNYVGEFLYDEKILD